MSDCLHNPGHIGVICYQMNQDNDKNVFVNNLVFIETEWHIPCFRLFDTIAKNENITEDRKGRCFTGGGG